MSAEPPPTSGPSRSRVAVPLVLVAVAAVVAGLVIWRRPPAADGAGRAPAALAQHDTPPAAPPPAPGRAPEEQPAAPAPAAAPVATSPLPELVPGSPLTDERFAEISSGIVIAAIGLKRDADWEANVLAYMARQLEKANVTPAQYNEYAQALHQNPDRGRAVAENIMRRVQQKVGYRITLEKLPMFKFDQQAIKEMEERLKH